MHVDHIGTRVGNGNILVTIPIHIRHCHGAHKFGGGRVGPLGEGEGVLHGAGAITIGHRGKPR